MITIIYKYIFIWQQLMKQKNNQQNLCFEQFIVKNLKFIILLGHTQI